MTTLAEPQVQTEPTRRRISVDEYMKMAEVGILKESERVELIDGDIIEMSQSETHMKLGHPGLTDFLLHCLLRAEPC